MKKFFSFVAVLCIAVAASANVVWTETLDKMVRILTKMISTAIGHMQANGGRKATLYTSTPM